MVCILDPIAAGIVVAIFNKYVLNKIDPLGGCCTQRREEKEED